MTSNYNFIDDLIFMTFCTPRRLSTAELKLSYAIHRVPDSCWCYSW